VRYEAIIEPLLEGAKKKLFEAGVKESNVVVQSVPGSWELPIAVQKYVLHRATSIRLTMGIISNVIY